MRLCNLASRRAGIFIIIFCSVINFSSAATYTVNFDGLGETKTGYSSGNVTLNGISWNLSDVLIGTTAGSDRFNGVRSARFRGIGVMTMNADKTGGVGTITLNHAKYSSDANSTWSVDVSNDGGASWVAYTSSTITTSSTTLTSQMFTVNVADGGPGPGVRIRINKLSTSSLTNRLNIDDIVITDYTPSNTTTCGAVVGAPFCITGATGATFNLNFTSTGLFAGTNDYTAQLSDNTGSFAIPTNIGVLSTGANSGTISVTIPAGTPSGNGYRIQIMSSAPASLTMNPSAAFSIYLNTPDVSALTSNSGNTSVTVSWANPLGCYDQVMVVAQPLVSVAATPSGIGYTASSTYGSGTAFGSGFVVYFGTGTNVTVTGLTNGTLYFFKVFVVEVAAWSPGIEISDIPNPFIAGDYRSVASGCWSNPAIWQTFNGLSWVAAASAPNSQTTNVTVTHFVLVTSSISPISVRDLVVNAGGKLYADKITVAGTVACAGFGNYVTTNIYISVYGSNLQVNGTGQIGNGYQFDWLGFNIEGANVAISGSNSLNTAFNASRLRKSYVVNAVTNCVIDLPRVNLWWNSASGTSLYNNSSGTFNLTVTANSNVTTVLSGTGVSGNACIDGTSGYGSGGTHGDGTFTINGILNVPGTLYTFTTNTTPGRSCNWIIGVTGIINCNLINDSASGAATHNFTIMNGGRLNINSNNVAGANPFINYSVINSIFNLQPGSIVEYSSSAAGTQIVNPLLTYSNLVISNAADKTVASNLTVNRDLTISGGSLQPGANTIFLGGDWNNYGSAGFLEATSKVVFQGTIAQFIYCIGGEDFYNVDITNAVGVNLANDVTVQRILDLTATGKLIFGAAQHILTLSDMSAGSDAFRGSAGAFMDLTGANHYLYIGSQNASYTGGFNAGTQSFVVYYRNNFINGLGVGGGDQNIIMWIVYANLSMIGTDNKYTNDNFTVTVNLNVDGPSTVMHATVVSRTLTITGNLTLSGGATMNNNCRDNLAILTSGNLLEVFDANFQTIKCYDLLSTKTAGGISLSSAATTVDIKNDLRIVYSGGAQLIDNLNTIKAGDDVEIGNNFGNFVFTGTLEFTGIGANGDVHLSDLSGTGVPLAVFRNLTVNTGVATGTLRIVEMMPAGGNQTYTITGNVAIAQGTNGGVMDPNANKLVVGGNWTTYDETGFTEPGSKVTFNGSALQTIFAIVFEKFDSTAINNSSTGVQMLAPVKTNVLQLQNGQLDLNYFRLTILNPLAAAVSGGSNSSYVKSETAVGTPLLATNPSIMEWDMDVTTGAHVFPFGVAGVYLPFTFDKLVSTSANIEVATRATTPDNRPWDDVTNVSPVSHMYALSVAGDGSIPVVIDRWWDINASVSGIAADVTFTYRGAENTITSPNTALAAQNWDGSSWNPPVCSSCNNGVTIGTGSVVVSGITVANMPWVLSGLATPLPVELIDFTATRDENNVLLQWTTSSEVNNDRFEILSFNSSSGRNDFEEIDQVSGSGNSTSVHHYSYLDRRPGKKGTYYYRLRQVDFDGRYELSDIVAVNFETGKALNFTGIVPNPYSDRTSVQLYVSERGKLSARIADVFGREVSSLTFFVDKGVFKFDPEETVTLASGVYFVELFFNQERIVSRLVKE